jgi:diguanylate cyclase (GGDEF)-like protein
LLLVNIDRFKDINDTLGHHAGDELLATVARRLRAAIHGGDTVVRLGGDEFAVLLADAHASDSAEATAQRLRQVIRDPVTVGQLTVETDASIGIAVAPDHGNDLDALLRCADVAMYHAKRTGLGIATYDPATDARDEHQMSMLAELRHAIIAGELRLHYQPKCRRDGTIEHVEALVRWQHPERGLLSPAVFMPLAERTSLIKPLTTWVLREASRQGAAWRLEGQPLKVAVNISPRNLADPELPAIVLDALAAAAIPADSLELEITETAVTTDPQRAKATLHSLRALGVGVSIDDFGVGYTSLSQLGALPADTLKIDQAFVADLLTDPVHEAVVRNIIKLARDLGLGTVAEGVESRETWDRLNEFGCDEIQGYVLTPPLPPQQFMPWLAAWRLSVTAVTASENSEMAVFSGIQA